MNDNDTNWLAIERDYCAGVIPIEAICLRHNITEKKLKSYTKERGLKRGKLIENKKQYLTVINPDDVIEATVSGKSTNSVFTPDELEKAALISAAGVVQKHRDEMDRARQDLNEMASWMMETKRSVKAPHELDDVQTKGVAIKMQNMILNSYSQYIGGLSKIIQMERQTYNLDVFENEKPVNTALEDQNNLLLALKEELGQILEQKSAYSGSEKTIYESEPIVIEEKK